MVKTRTEVKLKIGEWIEEQKEPFTTQEVKRGNCSDSDEHLFVTKPIGEVYPINRQSGL